LNILHQNPSVSINDLISKPGYAVQSAAVDPEKISDEDDDIFAEFDI